ncbi:hypothetical protein [Paracoccus sp. ME4]|uniref:hypothetical protein n=1 Tax=Paracoccus sp. ME4 TaxID=3138066 RepID=UPI00398AF06B
MPLSSYPILTENMRPARVDKARAAIADLEDGLARGEIQNAVYLRAKEMIGRAVEEAWDKAVIERFIHNRDHQPADETEAGLLREVGYASRPAPHTMKALRRKTDLLGDTVAGTAITGFLSEIDPLMKQIARGKEIAVKRLTGDAAREARAAASPLAAVSAPVLRRVEGIMRDLTAAVREKMVAQLDERGSRILEKYLKEQDAFLAEPQTGRSLARGYGPVEFSTRIGGGKSVPDIRMLIDALVTSTRETPGRTRYARRPDHQERLHKLSQERVEEICAAFIQRNMSKLAPIFDAKGGNPELVVVGNRINPAGMEADLRASFEDGSSFDIRTSVVWSQNQFGTVYARYPVTFHDVTLPDGSRMGTPSEARMQEIFVTVPASPQPDGGHEEDMDEPGF